MRILSLLVVVLLGCESNPEISLVPAVFNPAVDLLALHYDHAPDRDDGQSAVADRVILESEFGADWMAAHVPAVSGAYGENAAQFNPASDSVMDAVFADVGGWLAAHPDPTETLDAMADGWAATLEAGNEIWVKEGGQSDLTAEVVRRLQAALPDVDTRQHVHVVQHSDWNEDMTTDADLHYTKEHTDYIRIDDANRTSYTQGQMTVFAAACLLT